MKLKVWFALCCLALPICLSAAEETIRPSTSDLPYEAQLPSQAGNEIVLLDHLIEVTKQNLENQKQLKIILVEYQKIHQQFLKNTQDKELSYQLVMKAYQVLEKIKETHLTQSFDQEFMSELTFFANIGAKWKANPQ